ncbi:MAG TPA: VCBS repeat-containing protein [Phycisphaerae bacterium]|nr:VCBS repeat-containing protein [Phycisphaerae bacterium]
MGYLFTKDGRTYAAIGDLIMPGGVLGYSGSLDFSAADVLASLRKLAAQRPDEVLGGHGAGDPDNFIAKGIAAGEATGWSRMTPEKPDPFYGFAQSNYLVVAWLQPIRSAAYGDVDGDGRPDVAVLAAKGAGSAVRIYLNKGGRFADAPDVEIDLADLGGGWKLRLGHVNEDKVADLLATSEGQVILLLSQEGKLLFRRVALPGITRATQMLTGDFNGDGRTDLVLGSRFVGNHAVASRNADGTFRVAHSKPPGRMYFDIQLADVNGDQREDLLFSCGDILLRRQDGSLADAPAVRLTPPGGEQAGWAFMAAADFDHDGWTDVALLAGGKDGATVWLYRNTRQPQSPFPQKPSAAFVARGAAILRDGPTVADWNGDGVPDLVLGALGKSGTHVLLGSRADGLSPDRAVRVDLDYAPHYDTRLGVADFNGDGLPDLAGFGPSGVGAVGVYIRLQPAASTP